LERDAVVVDFNARLLAGLVRSEPTEVDAMADAITQTLTAAGWQVDAHSVGVHESCLKVSRPG
jgi:hypothetical protein